MTEAVTRSSAAAGEMYGVSDFNPAEAERLAEMGNRFADQVTLSTIESTLTHYGKPPEHALLLDVGAGGDPTLGLNLVASFGVTYVPTDRQAEAVSRQCEAGFSGMKADAAALPLSQNVVRIAHSRFVHGWLGPRRELALRELLHTGTPDLLGVIIDYDWSAAEGDPLCMNLIKAVRAPLEKLGFDPDYGSRMHADIDQSLERLLGSENYEIYSERHPMEAQPEDAISIALLHAQTMQSQLEMIISALPNDESRDEFEGFRSAIVSATQKLRDAVVNTIAQGSPLPALQLPHIVAVTFNVKSKELLPVRGVRFKGTLALGETYIEGEDYQPVTPGVEGMGHIAKTTAPELIEDARRLQSTVYQRHFNGYAPVLGTDGTLVEKWDPQELRYRSDYYAAMEEKGLVSVVRAIWPDSTRRLTSLPALEHLAEAYSLNESDLRCIFGDDAIVCEGSAWSSESSDSLDSALVIMGMVVDILQKGGTHMAVAALPGAQRLLQRFFGDTIERVVIGEEPASYTLTDEDFVNGSRTFRVLKVDLRDFFSRVRAHNAISAREDETAERLRDICDELLTHRG